MMKGTMMEEIIGQYARIALKTEITSMEDCTVEYFCSRLASVSEADADDLTVENYELGLEEFRRDHGLSEIEQEKEEALAAMMENIPSTLQSSFVEETELTEDPARQRKPMKLYRMGDYVQVYSNATGAWHDDGIVIEVLKDAGRFDGFLLAAGSMKAQYCNGRRFKWVTPVQAEDFLKG